MVPCSSRRAPRARSKALRTAGSCSVVSACSTAASAPGSGWTKIELAAVSRLAGSGLIMVSEPSAESRARRMRLLTRTGLALPASVAVPEAASRTLPSGSLTRRTLSGRARSRPSAIASSTAAARGSAVAASIWMPASISSNLVEERRASPSSKLWARAEAQPRTRTSNATRNDSNRPDLLIVSPDSAWRVQAEVTMRCAPGRYPVTPASERGSSRG